MMYRTDDPIADFNHYEEYKAEMRPRLPRCTYCNRAIDDDYWQINDEPVCDKCLVKNHRKRIDDYIE